MKGLFRRVRRVHFVGIGGIGMCGLAELLHVQGIAVSGSDLREGPTVARLRALGVEIFLDHDAPQVGNADVVVISSAVPDANPEVREARRREIPVVPRAELLAEIMRHKEGIAVAGTHGKTTTTSLVAHVLEVAGFDPTAVIGGRVRGSGADPTGARLGRGELLVAEADESDGSFLGLSPVVSVITNIEAEHLDHYGDEGRVRDAFVAFANRVPFFGLCVLCLDDPGVQATLPRITRPTLTYGFATQADLVAAEVEAYQGGMRFHARLRGERLGAIHLTLPGRHNVQNALAALAVALEFDVPFSLAAEAMESFRGIERRFETKGSSGGIRVVDDYAHHPTEIRATLEAARGIHSGRIVAVFQPHRYTRTRDHLDAFATAFHDAELLVVTDIYAAGEEPIPGCDAVGLCEAVRAHGHRAVRHIAELSDVPAALVPALRAGDLVITFGAGSITNLGPELLQSLAERETC